MLTPASAALAPDVAGQYLQRTPFLDHLAAVACVAFAQDLRFCNVVHVDDPVLAVTFAPRRQVTSGFDKAEHDRPDDLRIPGRMFDRKRDAQLALITQRTAYFAQVDAG